MSIYKEHTLPAINCFLAFHNFVEHIKRNNLNYTQNSTKTQAEIVNAFTFSVHKYIVTYVPDNDDKRIEIYGIAKNLKSTQFWLYSKQTSIRH